MIDLGLTGSVKPGSHDEIIDRGSVNYMGQTRWIKVSGFGANGDARQIDLCCDGGKGDRTEPCWESQH